jgi:hypothetical protein
MLVDTISGEFDSVEDFLFETEFILTSACAIALAECSPDSSSSVASLDRGFVFTGNGL